MAYRKPREIHYELTPRTQRRPVSVCRVIFALIVGILILAAILFALYVVWYVYGRQNDFVVVYDKNKTKEIETEKPAQRVVRLPQRKHFEVIVAYEDDNAARAGDVVLYLNKTLSELLDKKVYSDLRVTKIGSKGLQSSGSDPRMTLRVELRRPVRISSTVVAVSEQFPPTGQQIMDMIRQEHRICSPLNEARCVEICAVYLTPGDVPNITPASTEYEAIHIGMPNLVDYAQSSAIYRQSDTKLFSLTRFKKDCFS